MTKKAGGRKIKDLILFSNIVLVFVTMLLAGIVGYLLLKQPQEHLPLKLLGWYIAIACVMLLICLLLSKRLSRNIKRSLLGYEPDKITEMFVQRGEVLEALEEGIIAINRDSEIIFINQSAIKMINIKTPHPVGKQLSEVYPQSKLAKIMETGTAEYNVNLKSLKDAYVLSDRMPIRENGEIIGAVAIFRNKTEVTKLAEELTGVRYMVDAMRAYTHEFVNKLHVILGLVQIGEYEKVKDYILNVNLLQRESVRFTMERIEDASVAALLIGKISHAGELGITLRLDPGSHLSNNGMLIPADSLVTIIGNLMENAIDALRDKEEGTKEIVIGIFSADDAMIITSDDTGSGMEDEIIHKIFDEGFSTKGDNRGTGLYLVKSIVDSYGGQISVESEKGVGTSFVISIHKDEK